MATLESIGETFASILRPRSSSLSKFLGVLIAALLYYVFGLLVVPQTPTKKAGQLRRQAIAVLNAIVLTAAYIYSWSFGNPHDAQGLDNNPAFEVALMLTAGHYLLDMFPHQSILDSSHHVLSIIVVMELLTEGRGANVAVTFAFLVEIATLCYIARNVAIKNKSPCSILLRILYPTVFILVRFIFLLHLSINISNNLELPEISRGIVGIMFMYTFCYCYRMIGQTRGGTDGNKHLRGRSRTPASSRRSSRNRSRSSRSRSRTR